MGRIAPQRAGQARKFSAGSRMPARQVMSSCSFKALGSQTAGPRTRCRLTLPGEHVSFAVIPALCLIALVCNLLAQCCVDLLWTMIVVTRAGR